MIREQNILSAFLNMGALLIYDHVMLSGMKTICGHPGYPKQCRYIHVDDVNDPKCLAAVKKIAPDLLFIYGSGILKGKTIAAFGENIYNIHSSILPYYRNVHSDFRAYMDGKKDLIGVTIFKLDSGIDTGKIALQRKCDLPEDAKLYEYKAKNLENIPVMMEEFARDFFAGQIVLEPQEAEKGSVARTPTAKDLIRFFKSER